MDVKAIVIVCNNGPVFPGWPSGETYIASVQGDVGVNGKRKMLSIPTLVYAGSKTRAECKRKVTSHLREFGFARVEFEFRTLEENIRMRDAALAKDAAAKTARPADAIF